MEEPSQSWLTISAEPRPNRAVALSWPKVQVEIKAPQDTTSQAGTFISPEAEAGPSMLNRSSPADAVAPAGRERDTDGPSSPVDILALSTDFPTARLSAFEKPKVTSSLSPNTKPAPSPDSANAYADTADIAPSFTNSSLAAGSSGKEVSLTPPVIGEAGSSKKRVETNVDEPPSQSVPVAFPTSASSENPGTTATSWNPDLAKALNSLSQSQLDMDSESSNPAKSSTTVGSSDSDTATTATSTPSTSSSAPSIATGGGSPSPTPSLSSLRAPAASTSGSISTVISPVLVPSTISTDSSESVETGKDKGKEKERGSGSSSSSSPSIAVPVSSQATLRPVVVSKPERATTLIVASATVSTTADDVSATSSTSISGQGSDSRECGFNFPQSSSSSSFGSKATGPSGSSIPSLTSGSQNVGGIQSDEKGKDGGKQFEHPASSSDASDGLGSTASSSARPPFSTAALTMTRTRPNLKTTNTKPNCNPNSTASSTLKPTTVITPASANVTSNPNTTANSKTTASSSTLAEVWRTIDWSKLLHVPDCRVSNSDAFDFASPPPGIHTRATFHPFPESMSPVSFDRTHSTLLTLASFRDACWHWKGQGFEPRPATGEGLGSGSTEGGGVYLGSGQGSKGSTSTLGSGSSATVEPGEVVATGSRTTDGTREPPAPSPITSLNRGVTGGAEDVSRGFMVGTRSGGEDGPVGQQLSTRSSAGTMTVSAPTSVRDVPPVSSSGPRSQSTASSLILPLPFVAHTSSARTTAQSGSSNVSSVHVPELAASDSEVPKSGSKVHGADSDPGPGEGSSVSVSGTTNVTPPQAGIPSSSSKQSSSGCTGIMSSVRGLPGERANAWGLVSGMGVGVSMGTTATPVPAATSTSTAETGHGGSLSTPSTLSASPSVRHTGTGTASTVLQATRTTAPVPVDSQAQLPTRPQPQPRQTDGASPAPASGDSMAVLSTTAAPNCVPSSNRQPSQNASSNQAERTTAPFGSPSPSGNRSKPTITSRRAQTASVGDPAVTAMPPGRRAFATLRPAVNTPQARDVD
ncbi:hypothetical protein PQX77_021831 [Marasmius sp. AFHP31]|nr:hypothetical protein PQX77_021831 [Marasmius sp. AFHP31]